MSAVKNSDGNVSSYEGFCADFIINFAEHFEMRYCFNTNNYGCTPWFRFTKIFIRKILTYTTTLSFHVPD